MLKNKWCESHAKIPYDQRPPIPYPQVSDKMIETYLNSVLSHNERNKKRYKKTVLNIE